jgi:peroxin-1
MDGFLPMDIETVFRKALQNGVSRLITHNGSIDSLQLTEEDFREALRSYTPVNVRGLRLKSSTISWSDVGGI